MCAGPADRGARDPRLPGVGARHLQREPGGQWPLRVPGHNPSVVTVLCVFVYDMET